MINIKNVSFSYSKDKVALKNISLEIFSGECILLCGRSGCGKTTMTKLVNGIIPHFTDSCYFKGSVFAAGLNIQDTKMYELSKNIGSVFQNPKSQFFHMDSNSEIVFGLENAGVEPMVIEERLNDTLQALKIENLLNRSIFKMSGGEKQSLAFASVYAMNPDIYVLDEPTANLDANAIDILRRQIKAIKAQGKTVLVAEHRLYYLIDIVDKIVYMDNGRIANIFSRDEFLSINENDRINMGLRAFKEEKFINCGASKTDTEKGLFVENLSCILNNNLVFEDISFSVNEGDIVGIIGGNGTGKTTLMRCISGLVKEKSGSICFDGKKLKSRERNKICYMIMQDVNHQLFGESVMDEFEISNYVINKDKIEEILDAFNLLEFKETHPMALSGGQKQRLAIAAGVLTDKKILIFDEPTSGLDYEHMVAVSKVIKKLAENNHIILIITHDMEFLKRTCSNTINMEKYTNYASD